MPGESAETLWKKYLMLTQEMKKFLDRQDIDMTLSLMDQRVVIFDKLQALERDDFRDTEAGKSLLDELQPVDLAVQRAARGWLNKSRQQNTAVRSYGRPDFSGYSGSGHIFNKKL